MYPPSFFVFSLFLSSVVIEAKNLEISLYYESLCPDSIDFVTTQLFPSFQSIASYVELELIPFGKASADNSSGSWRFICQHGPQECYYNKVHSCAIALNPIWSSLDFIDCTMSDSNHTIDDCAKASGISWASLVRCLSSGEADDLLAQNGAKTKAVKPPISYIPTVIFNGVYDDTLQWKAQQHFLKVVCDLLKNRPEVCQHLGVNYNYV